MDFTGTASFTEKVKTAMKKTGGYPGRLWFDDKSITDILDEAEKRGWVRRISHTQIEWTEEGIKAVTEIKPEVEDTVVIKPGPWCPVENRTGKVEKVMDRSVGVEFTDYPNVVDYGFSEITNKSR